MSEQRQFLPLNLALMTISDSRTAADDKSGAILKRLTTEAGHQIHEQCIVRDDIYQIRAAVSRWIADPAVQAVITTGGTGITGRDGTPEAVRPLLDKVIDGFGEMFRVISYELIGTSTITTRQTNPDPTKPRTHAPLPRELAVTRGLGNRGVGAGWSG